MKRIFEKTMMALLGCIALVACSEDKGTVPGSDSVPVVTVYQFEAKAPLNSDNDCVLRLAANNKVEECYYLAELKTDKEARNMTADAYADYVVANGKKVDGLVGAKTLDLNVTDIFGLNEITVVAVGGGKKTSQAVEFNGLIWNDVASGTYSFSERAQSRLGVAATQATKLQQLSTDAKQYRFKDLYGVGNHLKLKYYGENASGSYLFFRVNGQVSPFSYGSYGTISIRDVAEWQNDESYATGSLGCYMQTATHNCSITLQYYVSAGSLGYGTDTFTAE